MAVVYEGVLSVPAEDVDYVAASQTLMEAGDLTLEPEAASIPDYAFVAVKSDGDDSGITFTIYGVDRMGRELSYTVAGGNTGWSADPTSLVTFASVTRIAASGATASTVTAGLSGTAVSDPFPMDLWSTPFSVSTYVYSLSGAASPFLGGTLAPIMSQSWVPTDTMWIDLSSSAFVTNPFTALRITCTGGPGEVAYSIVQTVNR